MTTLGEDAKRYLDALHLLSEQSWRDWDHKTKHEWRLSFGIWGALLGAMALFINVRAKIPIRYSICAGGLVFCAHALFLFWTRHRLEAFRKEIEACTDIMKSIVKVQRHDTSARRRWRYGSQATQMLITVFLALCLLWVTENAALVSTIPHAPALADNVMETELLDTGRITVHDIRFETNKTDIMAGAFGTLDAVGTILVEWPDLQIEVGGHADWRGSDEHNKVLSQHRADAVRKYLFDRFPKIAKEQYTAVGYGEARPIASNETPEGMARNRRVEFKVLNTEALKRVRKS